MPFGYRVPDAVWPNVRTMLEASSRLLVDRSVLRVDGRPFFTFGPRLLLTPPEKLGEVCASIAAAGFTAVASMPASPALAPVVERLFDEAATHGLLVVLVADRRFLRPGRFLAEKFRARTNLHSYCLPWDDAVDGADERFLRDRDDIRALDLFHPVWAPLGRHRPSPPWLRSMDLYAAPQIPWAASAPPPAPVAERLAEVSRQCRPPSVSRPLLCSSLAVATADADRQAGLYDEDETVRTLPREAAMWFPGYVPQEEDRRRDWLGPDPGSLRLRTYELLSHGVRGVMLDFHEAMLGTAPFSGRDRLAEATILAQEIAVLRDFFAEGTTEMCLLEAGHPRLRAAVLRHGEDHLILLRATGEDDGGTAGECHFQRTEVDIRPDHVRPWNAWRIDFPGAHPLGAVRDASRALRIACGTVDMTALVLLTAGRHRAEEISAALELRLPVAARAAVEGLEIMLAKVDLIEGELRALNCGIVQEETVARARIALRDGVAATASGKFTAAWDRARFGQRELRLVMRVQLARARVETVSPPSERREALRRSYYTLPTFYKERSHHVDRSEMEFT